MSVTGDTAVVTLHTGLVDPTLRGSVTGMGARVDRVARGYSRAELGVVNQRSAPRGAAAVRRAQPTGREESLCGRDDKSDAVCYRETEPVIYHRSKAVVRLLIGGVELCTGWRIGPNNRLITNHHCFANGRGTHDTEVWFNYQCAACGGFPVFRSTKVWVDRVLVTDNVLDFTLFTVDNFAAVEK